MPTKKKSVKATNDSALSGDLVPKPNNKRAVLNKRINQQAMRDRLQKQGHISEVIRCIKELDQMDANLKKRRKALTDAEQKKIMLRTGILTKAIDSRMKLISKYLPDLRSINFEDEDGGNPLETAISAWAKALTQEQ